MTHSYEDIIRLDSEVPTPPYKVVSHSWRETSIYDAKNRRVCLFDLEDWSVTERNQYELEVKQHNLAQYIAAMPDAVGLLKEFKADNTKLKQLLDRAMQGLEAIANAEAFDSWGDLAGRAETTLADIRKQLDGDSNGG